MHFKNLSIKTKLILALLIPFILMTIIVIINFIGLTKSKNDFKNYINGANHEFNVTQSTRITVNNLARILRDAVIDTNNTKISTRISEATELKKSIELYLSELDNYFISTNTNDISTLKEYQQSVRDWLKIGDRIIVAISQNNNSQAIDIMLNECTVVLDKVESTGLALEKVVTRITNESFISVEKSISNINILTFILLAFVFCTSVLLGYIALKTLMVPVRALMEFSDQIKKGNLHTKFTYNSKNEMGILSDSLLQAINNWISYINEIILNLEKISEGNLNINMTLDYPGDFASIKTSIEKIGDSLNGIMSQIRVSSDQVATGSDQVASASQSLAQGSTEQASAVDDLANSISEISVQVNANAKNAKSANEMANRIGHKINQSNDQMNNMMSAMQSITEKSNEISKIIKTIEDIAFNTNILALNAAVEAARAGNAGKGFAVVADEVRNLASKSSEAAKNTTALISDSIAAVENGTSIAKSTAQSLNQVVEGANQITTIINDIAKASQEQANSIYQINTGIDQISAVVQTNSATSEESAAASEQLSGQANMLKSLVNKFKLKNDMHNSNVLYSHNNDEDDFFDDFNVISKY